MNMTTTATTADPVARIRVLDKSSDLLVAQLTGTNYQLHLKPTTPITAEIGKRTKGIIRVSVWKVDFVSVGGGAFVEPIMGRPRRVQGRAIGKGPGQNSVIVEVSGCPIVGDLPERWAATDIKPGTRVGLEVYDGATFEPMA